MPKNVSRQLIYGVICLGTFISLQGQSATTSPTASDVVSPEPIDFLEFGTSDNCAGLLKATGWQHLLWAFQAAGDSRASNLEAYLSGVLSLGSWRAKSVLARHEIGYDVELLDFGNGIKGVMKPDLPEHGLNSYAEVAAYRLDKLLGHASHVPLTVFREDGGKRYSIQLYVNGAVRGDQKIPRPNFNIRLLDYLTDNRDRILEADRKFQSAGSMRTKGHNLLVLETGEPVAIDNGQGFRYEFAIRSRIQPELAWSLILRDCCTSIWDLGGNQKQIELNSHKAAIFLLEFFGGVLPASYSILVTLDESQIRTELSSILPETEIRNLLRRINYLKQMDHPTDAISLLNRIKTTSGSVEPIINAMKTHLANHVRTPIDFFDLIDPKIIPSDSYRVQLSRFVIANLAFFAQLTPSPTTDDYIKLLASFTDIDGKLAVRKAGLNTVRSQDDYDRLIRMDISNPSDNYRLAHQRFVRANPYRRAQ